MIELRKVTDAATLKLRVTESVARWGYCTLSKAEIVAAGLKLNEAWLAATAEQPKMKVEFGTSLVFWYPAGNAWK